MNKSLLSLLALLVAAACTERPTAVQTPAGKPSLAGVTPIGDYVATPHGWYHRSCVHEIPSGARVDAGGLVTRRDGSTYAIPKCLYPSYRAAWHAAASAAGIVGPFAVALDTSWPGSAWITETATTAFDNGDRFRKLTAKWHVPSAPLGSYPSGTVRTYYAFPALETLWYNDLMPALQYGYNGEFGGSYWTLASWWVTDSLGGLYSTPDTIVQPGDQIYGSVTASSCTRGTPGMCTWTVFSADSTYPRIRSTIDTVARDSDTYGGAYGGRVEAYNVTSCDEYPSPGVFFNNIALSDTAGSLSSRSWLNFVFSSGCYFAVTSWYQNGIGAVNLFHASLLDSVAISGPSVVRPNQNCGWFANPTGGVPPYSYSWNPVGTQDGNEVIESFASSGWLTAWVSDSLNQQVSAKKWITVSSSAPKVCPYVPQQP